MKKENEKTTGLIPVEEMTEEQKSTLKNLEMFVKSGNITLMEAYDYLVKVGMIR